MTYLATPLSQNHNRKSFNCGELSLDNYIKTQVSQDVKKKLAACFVFAEDDNVVNGYYTLSNTAIPMSDAPEEIRSKMPRAYTDLPATLLGRLAVDNSCKGQGMGASLLMDALKRSYEISKLVASHAVVVDPIDQNAIAFYKKYGFVMLDSGKMFITMKTIGLLIDG
ncbi:GNAT family N-acetyltransferase [Chitinophagaceae bacterium 26-R-25]|nr:GNAT family N-acetyltransferase [Chitinophagaceae bacterium 26-R-25]